MLLCPCNLAEAWAVPSRSSQLGQPLTITGRANKSQVEAMATETDYLWASRQQVLFQGTGTKGVLWFVSAIPVSHTVNIQHIFGCLITSTSTQNLWFESPQRLTTGRVLLSRQSPGQFSVHDSFWGKHWLHPLVRRSVQNSDPSVWGREYINTTGYGGTVKDFSIRLSMNA